MPNFYRKGKPTPGCCWFRGKEGRDEALNWEARRHKEEHTFNGVSAEEAYSFLERNRSKFYLESEEVNEENEEMNGRNDEVICKLMVNNTEEVKFFKGGNGIGYQLSRQGFHYLTKRIEVYSIEEFREMCEDEDMGRSF